MTTENVLDEFFCLSRENVDVCRAIETVEDTMFGLGDELSSYANGKSQEGVPEDTAYWNYLLEENENYK